MWIVRMVGILIFIVGFALIYCINRRRFNRRAITGMQMFSSYEHAWLITYLEKFGKLVGVVMILGGIILFFAAG